MSKSVFFSASQQGGNLYHCRTMNERQYCEHLVDIIISRLPAELEGYSNHELDYSKRPAHAKQLGVDAYVTIHTNGYNGIPRGLEIGTSGSAQDRPLAEAIYKVLEPLTPAADRGIKIYNLFEARQPVMPSCYLELSFHDNHEDEQWLLAHTEEIAKGIIEGLCDYFNIDPPAQDKPSDTEETAQLRAYVVELERENKALAEKIAAAKVALM